MIKKRLQNIISDKKLYILRNLNSYSMRKFENFYHISQKNCHFFEILNSTQFRGSV